MVRAAEDRLRVADLHDPPEVEHGDPVGEVADDAEVVRDQQVARPALGLQLGQQVEDRGLDRDVERAGRLVGDDDPRVAGECPGDRQPLLEAAGQLTRLEVEVALGQPQVRGELVDPLVDGLALEPGELADRARQDVARGPAAIERRVGVLEDHLEGTLVLRRPAARLGGQGVLIELDRAARVRPLDAQDRPRQGRFARARLADEPEGLAVAQLQGRRRPAPARRGRSGGRSSTPLRRPARRRHRSCRRRRSTAARPSRPACRCGGSATTGRRRHRTTGGTTVRHSSSASWQRSTNTQVGRFVPICGRLPGIVDSARSDLRTPRRGSERSRPSVYGCFGSAKTVAASPSSTILPAYITPTRSHSVRMTPRLWAISRTAAFVSAWSVRTRSRTLASTVASSPVVGSSRTSSFGSEASAMAMTTRCCIPPDS